jgi:excisionase family DNA binding protein
MAQAPPPQDRRAPANDPEWLTLGQAAKYLGVAQSTLRKWSDAEMIQAFYTPGRHRRYRRSDLDAFLERSGPGAAEATGPRVLVVDDDAGMRAFVRAGLETEGFDVYEAASAREGLEFLEDEALDLILLDVMMPGMDGWEMLQRVQERHGAIPVIMFSGKVDAAGVAEQRGASGFVSKQSDPLQIVERAKQILSTRA